MIMRAWQVLDSIWLELAKKWRPWRLLEMIKEQIYEKRLLEMTWQTCREWKYLFQNSETDNGQGS